MRHQSAVIYWVRRDLRLSDNPALTAAVQSGKPVIPVVINDQLQQELGAAPKWRLGLGLEHFSAVLEKVGATLIFRSGEPHQVLEALINETGADHLVWNRMYETKAMIRDSALKKTLKQRGIKVDSFGGAVLFEPMSVETKTGGYYRVFTPYWNAVKNRDVTAPLPKVTTFNAPSEWPRSDKLSDWQMAKSMGRGVDVTRAYVQLGETEARSRLADFLQNDVAFYSQRRDIPSVHGTSGIAENLALGEISPRQCWHAALRAHFDGNAGAEAFLRQLVWRDFAYHLLYHTPHIAHSNWKPDWDKFPWSCDEDDPKVQAWKQGRTGVRFVDAAMREMYVTGRMHNRGRMIVASYLTKHLMCHWRIGQKWFEECLIDWDCASNAMGWQWAAGSGPDAAPYFRIFNPDTQLGKFDPDGVYQERWIAEIANDPAITATSYFDAIPKGWKLKPDLVYPDPVVTLSQGRQRALNAYENRCF